MVRLLPCAVVQMVLERKLHCLGSFNLLRWRGRHFRYRFHQGDADSGKLRNLPFFVRDTELSVTGGHAAGAARLFGAGAKSEQPIAIELVAGVLDELAN